MSESMELVVVPEETALTVFTASKGLDPFLEKVKAEIDAFVPGDITVEKNRKAIASMAAKVARVKTKLDEQGKRLVDELKEVPKKIDAERKRMRDTLDEWKDQVRAPLNEWEAEQQRIRDAIQARLAIFELRPVDGLRSGELADMIKSIEDQIIDESWGEFLEVAATTKDSALRIYRDKYNQALKYEAEQEELARLREMQAEQERRAREEAIKKEAEARVAREAKEAAARAKAEADAKLLREKEAKEAAELRAQQAEQEARDKLAREQAAEKAAQEAREANAKHVAKVNKEVKAALSNCGVPEKYCDLIVKALAEGKIKHVNLSY